MDLIEAGKICRDSGFNWGRGSWWFQFHNKNRSSSISFEFIDDTYNCAHHVPDLSKGATRGVILEWAREMSGIPTIYIFPYFNAVIMKEGWDACSLVNGEFDFNTETEIECYARLCQWVAKNKVNHS